MKGIVIAGTHSGCGKTTVTMGLLAALQKKGLRTQSFKAGPDFIDSGLHRLITGRPSRNLDMWMCGESYVRSCFSSYSEKVDFSVIEGVMGMFDGEYNTASLASLLGLPVVLVVDSFGIAESAGAVVRGFREQSSERGTDLAGVIFNRVASKEHFRRLSDGVTGTPVLGFLPRNMDFEIPHRHLGLKVAEEHPLHEEAINRLAETMIEQVDLE